MSLKKCKQRAKILNIDKNNKINCNRSKNSDEFIKSLEIIENFMSNTYFLLSPTFERSLIGDHPNKRLFIAGAIRFTAILIFLRYGISSIVKTKFIIWLTSNANQILNHYLLISLILS